MSATDSPIEPKPLGILTPETHVTALRFSPCGSILAGACFDQRIRRWDLRSFSLSPEGAEAKKKVTEFPAPGMPDVTPGHNGFVSGLAFHPKRVLAVSADTWGGLRAWSYLGEKPEPLWSVDQAHDGWIRDLAMGPGGEWLATCGRDRKVCVWSTIDGRLLRKFDEHGEDVFAVAVHPGGGEMASADLRGRILIHDVSAGRVAREFACEDFFLLHRLQDLAGVRRLKYSRDGSELLVIGTIPTGGANFRGQAQVRMLDAVTGKTRADQPIGTDAKNAICHDAELLPCGRILAVTTGQSGQGGLYVQRPGEEEPEFQLTRGTVNNHSLALSPDRRLLAVAATNSGSNGNGKRLDKEGNYAGNHSPVHLFGLG